MIKKNYFDFFTKWTALSKEGHLTWEETRNLEKKVSSIKRVLFFLKIVSVISLFFFYSYLVKISEFYITFKFSIRYGFFLKKITLIIIFVLPLNFWLTIIYLLFSINI